MTVRELIDRLEHSSAFLLWRDSHPDAFLMSVFGMFDSEPTGDCLVSYFEGHKVATFFAGTSECSLKGEESSDKSIEQLDISNLKIELKDSLLTAKAAFGKKTGESFMKVITILQNLGSGPVWNISIMSSSYNVFNVRINAETGSIISEDYAAMFRPA